MQLGLAVHNYHSTFGCFPPAYVADESGRPMHSWRILITPFLEQAELYNSYNFREPWDGPNNRTLLAKRPSQFVFHGDASNGGTFTNYLAVVGPETAWPGANCVNIKDIRDGTSLTILVVENEGSQIHWTEPRDLDFTRFDEMMRDPVRAGISSKYAPPGALMADGSARRIPVRPNPETLRAFFTIAGGEKVDEVDFYEMADGRLRPKRSGNRLQGTGYSR
jgi:hypothetical protein